MQDKNIAPWEDIAEYETTPLVAAFNVLFRELNKLPGPNVKSDKARALYHLREAALWANRANNPIQPQNLGRHDPDMKGAIEVARSQSAFQRRP
jgi:hypothetical protein